MAITECEHVLRLETLTKQYGVFILLSDKFLEFSSKETEKLCREIDRITVKGSNLPIGLFTIGVDLENREEFPYKFPDLQGKSKKQSFNA